MMAGKVAGGKGKSIHYYIRLSNYAEAEKIQPLERRVISWIQVKQ